MKNLLKRFLDDERGSAMPIELLMFAPLMVFVIGILVTAFRTGQADNSTQNAAMAAARAASLSRDAASAENNAVDAARRTMANAGISCSNLVVSVDASGLNAPIGITGIVSTTVTCTVNLEDISVPGIPGTRDMSSSATSPVDAYRARR